MLLFPIAIQAIGSQRTNGFLEWIVTCCNLFVRKSVVQTNNIALWNLLWQSSLSVVLSCCTGYLITKGIYIALTFESEHSILKYDHSNLSYVAVLLWVNVYYAVKGVSYFLVCGWNPKVWPFKKKVLGSAFLWYCLLCCTRLFWLLCL